MSQDSTTELFPQIHDFPTTGQPLSDTTMKEMLVSLRGSLHRDLMQCVSQMKSEVAAVGEHVNHVENKMAEFASAHNELVDAHNDKDEELESLKSKMVDLKDRSHRNNVKLCGVVESVTPSELRQYVQQLITNLLPDTLAGEIIVDRAHRLPKPQHLPDKIPRDVLARMHFFHVKDDLMHFSRQHSPLPDPYMGIFSDLSQYTMMALKKLVPHTKLL